MKIFSWTLVVVGFLVTVGAVNDPTGEKPLDQMVFWAMAGIVTTVTGWLTGRSWEKRDYMFPLCYTVLGIVWGGTTARDWLGKWPEHAATTSHLFTLTMVMVLYGIGLLAAMAIRDRLELERSQRG